MARSIWWCLLAATFSLPAMGQEAAKPDAPKADAGGKAQTEITWFGHAAFQVTTPKGTVLLIDPWLSNPSAVDTNAAANLTKADYILVSHGHFDHVGDAADIAKRTQAKLVAGFELGTTLTSIGGYPSSLADFSTLGNAGGSLALTDEVTVAIVPAVHSSGFRTDEKSGFSDAGAPTGFVIQIKGGPTIYHTGDTDVFGDMKLIGDRWHPDVMLTCIGGHFTMDPAGAALAVSLVRPKKVVPMHFGTFPVLNGTPADFKKEVAKKGKFTVVDMNIGEAKAF